MPVPPKCAHCNAGYVHKRAASVAIDDRKTARVACVRAPAFENVFKRPATSARSMNTYVHSIGRNDRQMTLKARAFTSCPRDPMGHIACSFRSYSQLQRATSWQETSFSCPFSCLFRDAGRLLQIMIKRWSRQSPLLLVKNGLAYSTPPDL
jgi:hypothetical protein